MKRKALVVACVVAVLAACGATQAFAAGRMGDAVRCCGKNLALYCENAARGVCGGTAGVGGCWVDFNCDGICDNAPAGTGANWTDADGDGVCDNLRAWCGTGWVDENEDGVCDNVGTRQGQGGRMGNGQGKNAQYGCGRGMQAQR